MRGLLVRPAGVTILLAFEDDNPQLWVDTQRAWAALAPEVIEHAGARIADGERVTVLSSRPADEITQQWGDIADLTVVNSSEPAVAAERLAVDLTLHLLREYAGTAHLLHAAVLGDASSHRALALVAPSGTGKTTAARFLGEHITYLTDETAVVMPDRSIRPYPKPLSIIEDAQQPKVQHNPADFGLRVIAADDYSFHLHRIVVLNRVKGKKVVPSIEPLPLAEALLTISEQSSGLMITERGLEVLAGLLVETGGAVKLTYSEITDALPLILSLLHQDQDQLPESEVGFTYLPAANFLVNSDTPDLYQRSEGSTGLVCQDRYLVAQGNSISEVSIYAWDCWEMLAQPLPKTEIHARLQELYGPIPERGFEESLLQLEQAGLLLPVVASPL